MKALSVMQPWAWLIVHGLRDIENRDWPTRHRGRIYVHASRQWDTAAGHRTALSLLAQERGAAGARQVWLEMQALSRLGCLIGEVDIVDCVTSSESRWFTGKHGFVLANPVAYTTPIPLAGGAGLFDINLAMTR